MQGHCEKETGNLGKACDMLVDIQSAPSHTLMHTHISFPPQVLRASQLLGVPLQYGVQHRE